MEIPKYIVDVANKINEHAKKQKALELQLINWIESKGFAEEDFGESDIIAELTYGNYDNVDDFVYNLKNAMEENDWISRRY